GKTLKFSDEFTNTTLDSSKWLNYFVGGKRTHEENNELQLYSDKNVTISNGVLRITAKKETNVYNGVTYNYTSGLIRSKYSFTYGYVEAKAQTPKGVGFWPTIWLLARSAAITKIDKWFKQRV